MKIFRLFLAFVITSLPVFAIGTAGNNAKYESRFAIDFPTAGLLKMNHYSAYLGYQANNSLLLEVLIAPLDWLNCGLSYSGTNLVGSDEPIFQGLPGISIKSRIFDERKNTPAIALGFSNQQKGSYIEQSDRFEQFSPGFYLALSKNFKWDIGQLAVHSGINYSIEPKPENQNINYWIGLEQSLSKNIALNLEFIAGSDEIIQNNKNKINFSLRASLLTGLTVELQLRHINNSSGKINRSIFIDLINIF